MDILEKLWLGQISPIEDEAPRSEGYLKALRRIAEDQQALKSMLPDNAKAIWASFNDSEIELQDYAERSAFSRGFCLGVKLMIAVMKNG